LELAVEGIIALHPAAVVVVLVTAHTLDEIMTPHAHLAFAVAFEATVARLDFKGPYSEARTRMQCACSGIQ